MSDKSKKLYWSIFSILMIVFSVYLLFLLGGFWLDTELNIKYGVTFIDDEKLKYYNLFAKIFIVYIIIMLVVLIRSIIFPKKRATFR
jgi:hypothetical protein